MNSYYTWRDIERIFKYNIKSWNEEWIDINVYNDEVIISTQRDLTQEQIDIFSQTLREIFGYHFNTEYQEIKLDYGNNVLKVIYEKMEDYISNEYIPIFKDMRKSKPNPSDLKGVPVTAFHSYKGGVGRTLSMLSTISSYSALKKDNGNPYKLLIIDSDIEAPGLTWLATETSNIDISLLDALSIIHENDNWEVEPIRFIAKKIKESVLQFKVGEDTVEHYFLPVYRVIEGYKAINQIMSMSAAPEHLVQMTDRQWIIGDFFSQLGKELDVDAVIVDLRAGISEFSAPLLLDPRIRKIYVTSTSLQSRKGTNVLLREIYKESIDIKYPEPYVFISMVLNALSIEETNKMQDEILDGVEVFNYKSSEISEEDVDIKFEILPFAEELVHLEGLDMIYNKLFGTLMAKRINSVVKSWVEISKKFIPNKIDEEKRIDFLDQLNKLTNDMEYAEQNKISKFLVTAPMKSLVRKFKYEVPIAVILGAKGSGKTFIYSQLVRSILWEKFIDKIEMPSIYEYQTYMVPVLKPSNIENHDFINKNTEQLKKELNFNISIKTMQDISDRIKSAKFENETEWKDIWKKELINSLGIGLESLEELQSYLENKNKRIVFVIDGIEDMFQNLSENKNQKLALRSLMQGLVNEIRSIPNSYIGIIIFSRIDFAMNSIEQNFGQFRAQFAPYELKWTTAEALRLVLWIVSSIKDEKGLVYFNTKNINIENYTVELIIEELNKLWGVKLGKFDSKESNSANWVLAALSDLKGQLQPRDVVRFLKYSSKECKNEVNRSERNKKIWEDRYLTPTSIRNSIEPCSKDKILEIKQEMEVFEAIFEKLEKNTKKQIPFKLEEYELTNSEAELLVQQGYLYKLDDYYYMPEIIRYGLNFESTRKGRNKVISIIKKV